MISVLGVDVSPERLQAWAGHLAPDPQPFVVTDAVGFGGDAGTLTPEVRDTLRLWAAPADARLIWLTRDAFRDLPRSVRATLVRDQVRLRNGDAPGVGRVPTVRAWSDLLDPDVLRAEADGHRFVWWPDLVGPDPAAVLTRLVETNRLPSRHHEVAAGTWDRCASVLPEAQRLAGSWGPPDAPSCCFSTVMEAAGADSAGSCRDVGVFERWLRTACRPTSGASEGPGVVLVWRQAGAPVHAAICLGDGWALEKASQEWHSPRAVARTSDVIRTARLPGQHLERHVLVNAFPLR